MYRRFKIWLGREFIEQLKTNGYEVVLIADLVKLRDEAAHWKK